jgi:hypothetical protein
MVLFLDKARLEGRLAEFILQEELAELGLSTA